LNAAEIGVATRANLPRNFISFYHQAYHAAVWCSRQKTSLTLVGHDGLCNDQEARLGESGRFTFDFRVPAPGDLDGDNDADVYDLIVIVNALGTPATGPDDPRDLNQDGTIDHLDAQLFVAQFFPDTLPGAGDLLSLVTALGTPAAGSDDPRDLDRDGTIDAFDAQRSAAQCFAAP
jgi:hypothetical protein